MRILENGAKYSAIVGIGEELKKKSQETGQEYLFLNRGINAVVNIDLSEIIPLIDFNSNSIQIYPANSGITELKAAISQVYFHNKTDEGNIYITNGGMNALDLVVKTLDVDNIYIADFFWGAYKNILKINSKQYRTYENFGFLKSNINQLKKSAVIICDPNNPLGTKFNDVELLNLINLLNANGVVVIWDSPYRRLFLDETDEFYSKLLAFENVIITDSFSKSLGLSGQRIGFVHCQNKEFNNQFNINLLYNTNGISAFSQLLVQNLLMSEAGKKASLNFRERTVADIAKNIKYLKENNLLANEFYTDAEPIGIFVIVNITYQELLDNRIGSVPLSFFSLKDDKEVNMYSRICVSVEHSKFKLFFNRLFN